MANSATLAATLPLFLPGGEGPVYEYEVTIDTINTGCPVRSGTTGRYIIVVGLELNASNAATVTFKSGGSLARSRALTLNNPLSGFLYLCRSGEDLSIQSTATSTSILVRVIEITSTQMDAVLSMGGSGGSGAGTSGDTAVGTSSFGMANVIPETLYSTTLPTKTNSQLSPVYSDENGAILVNTGVKNYAPTQTSVTVATSDTLVIAANSGRAALIIQNTDATNFVRIALDGFASAADATCYKLIAGATLILEGTTCPNTEIRAIADTASVVLHVTQFV